MKKQVLSLFMAFVLSFSMLPMSAFAGGETGSTEISMNGGETVTGGDAGKNAAGGVYQENDPAPGGGIYDPGDVTGGVSVMSVEGGEHTEHCICGGSETVNGHTHDTTTPEWTEWTETDSLPSSEGSYYLTQSVTSDWTVPEGNFKLCLNGQTFFGSITISTGATLTLTDCTGNGKLQGGVLVNGGTFELYGGTITGGVQVGINGGDYQTGSTFTMYGGSISGNTVASGSGGGVFLVGTTNQTDPPRFTMHGGTISNNTAGDPSGGGGGVYVGEKCIFTMDGGTITGNTATGGNGGGIYIHMYSTVNISGGEITKNTANGSGVISYGGGIYSERALTVSNATITENTADAGGGIYGKGSITLTDATVTGNNSYDIYLGAEESAKAYLKVSGLVNIGYYANYAWKLPIYVSGALDADSVIRVGVYDGLKPDVGGKLTIAEPADGVTLNAENFKADAVDCVTGLDENGTVYLALCEHVMDDTGYTCRKCGVTLDARVGENAYYQTLAKAFSATKGDTVTLLRDVTLNANCSAASSYDTTLDLNGKSISGASYRVTVGGGNNAGTLTIKNSDANSGAQALNAKFLVFSNGKLAVDSSYTGDIACVELQAGGTLERLGGKIGELILGTAASSATNTDYNVTLWNGNTSYCTIGKVTDSTSAQSLTVVDLLKTNHAKCELYGEKDGTWIAIDKTTKIAELNGYTAYRVQFPECEHQCSDESNPVCSVCGKALVVKATATAADGTAKTAYFTADSTLENGYVEAVQTLNNWSSEGCKDATLMPLCNVHNGTGGIGIASVTLTGTLAVDGGEHRIYSTIVEAGADVTFKSGQYNHITVNGKAVFMGGTYLSGVNVAEGAEAVFSGGEYQSLTVKEGGTAVVKDSAAFQDDVEIRGTLNVEDGSFAKQVHVQTGCTLNVSGGVFTGTGYKNVTYESGSYGTISGGTFTDLLIRGDTVRLSGGTFTTLSTYSSDVFSSLLTDNAAYYNIADNTIIENPSGNKLENVFVQTHEHNVDENGICSICQKQMTVSLTIGDDTSWYTTFEAVIDAANAADGEKIIKLYKEVNENVNSKATTYELTNGPVTLETEEKTIQYVTLIAKGIALEITGIGRGSNGSKFYVTSDGTGATVTVSDSQTIITSITAQNGGKLLLSDGTYASLEVMDDGSSAELSGGNYSKICGTAGSNVLPYALLAKGYGYKDNSKNYWVIANVMNRDMENVTVEKAPIDLNIKIYPNDKTDFEDTLFNASVGSTVKLTATIGSGDDVIYDWRYLDSNKQWQGISGLSGVTYSYGEATFTINDLPNGGYQFAVFVKISSGENADYGCYSELFTISTGPCDHVWGTDGKCTKCDEECIHPLGYEDGKCMICGYQCPHKMAGSADGQSWYCATCDLEVVVRVKTADGSFTHGTDLATALNEAADGTTVSLLTDTSLSQMVFICGADDNSNKTVTLDLSGHEFTGSPIFNIGTTPPYDNFGNYHYYPGTLKIIGQGNIKLSYTLNVKATGTLDLSEWKGGTIHGISLQWNSNVEDPEPSLIVGEKVGSIELLKFSNWQADKISKTTLSGGSYGTINVSNVSGGKSVQLGDLLVSGDVFKTEDGAFLNRETKASSLSNVSVVKCPHSGTSGVSEDGKCACGQVQFVAQITGAAGSTVYYATITDAANALADGDTLKLLVDADSDVIIDKAVTVDLNSHKLNALTANAKLTVKDYGETKGTIGTLTAGNGLILGDLLADGYGFKATDGTWVAETETNASNVTVQEAPLKNVTLAADNETVKYGQSQTVKLKVSYETVGEGSASQTWYAVAEDGTATPIADETELTYTLPADLSAGTYTYRVTVSKDGYSRSVDTVITVEKLDLKDAAVVLENNGIMMFLPDIFSGAGTEVTQNVESVTIDGIPLGEADYEVTGNVEADAGSYTLTITAAADNVNFIGSKQVGWTIRAHKLSSVMIKDAVKDYDGTADLLVNVVTGMFVSAEEKSDYSAGAVKLSEGKDYKLSDMTYDSPDAGDDKTISYTIELLSDNYIFDDGTKTKTFTENSTTSVGLYFKINKVAAEVSAAPTANELTYNGSERELVTAGEANGGTMQYSLDGADYSETIPTGKDAKTYTVYYKVVGDKNHNDTIAQSVEVTIEKAVVTVTADDKSSRVGKALEELTYTYSPELFGNDVFTGTLATEADKDIVKTYTITQGTLALSGNYTITFVPGTYTVEAKIIPTVVEGTLSATEITYGQPLSESKITGTIKGDVPGVFAWMDSTMMLDAGIHEVSWIFTPENIADYTLVTDKVKVTVNPKSIEGATVTLNRNSFEYNTTAQAPTVTGVKLGDTMLNTADYSVTIEAQINAGDYTVAITGKGNYTGEATASWTITPKTVTNPTIELIGSFSYTGEAIKPAVTVKDGETEIPAGEYEVSYKDNTNAGTATVIIADKEGGNYTVSGSTTFKIEKVDSEVSVAPAVNELTYNGSEQPLVTAGTAKGGTMQYSLNGADYSNVIPTGKDAKTYTVYYKVVGDKNHNDAIAKSVEVEIKKAAVTVTADDKSSRVGKELETLTYTCAPGLFGDDAFTGTLATTANKDIVNTYAITQGTLALSENYIITFVDGTYTVTAKSVPTVEEGTLSATAITYGQALSESTITGTMKDDNTVVSGTFAWVDDTMMLNAGSHEVSWRFTPDNTADYEVATGKVEVTVNPRSIDGATVTLNQNSFEYNTTEQAPIVTGVKLGDTMLNTADYSVTIEAQINAGDYTVAITGKGNYTGEATASWTITPKTVTNPTIELTGSFSYTGEAIEPAVIVKDGEIEIPVGEYEVSYKDNTNAGAATVTITDKEGGNYTVNGSTTFKIEKVDSEVTAAPEANELIYNGSEQELVTAGEAKGGTMQYSLNGADYSETIPTGKDAKIYTVYYKVVGDSNHNDAIAKSVEVTIGKAAVTVKADDKSSRVGKDLEDLTYTCAPGLFGDDVFTGTLATTADKDAVNTYEIMQGSLALSNNYIITFVPGTYTVEAKLEQSGFKFSENTQTRTYGDADFTVSVDGVAENSTVTYSSSNTDVATVDNNGKVHILKVGSTVITAKASETADYLEATASYTLTVAKKSITAPVADATVFTYNGKAQTYKLTAGEGYAISGSLTETNANDNGYLITVSLTDKQNTKWAGSEDDVTDKSFRFVIHKAAVSVTAKDRSAYVGDTAPALPAEAVKGTDYTVSGLFDEDTLSGTVTLTYAGTPDMTKEGIASINISGTLANANYTVSYVPGKLTIVNRPSSGGDSGNSGSGTSGDNGSGNTGSGTTGGNGSGNSGSGTTGDSNTGNTGSGTTGNNGAGNTGSGTTGDSNTGNTGSDTTETETKPGTGADSDTSKETTPAQINVIISRGENTVQIAAKVNENIVTVDTIDFDKLDDVFNGTDDVVTIDISKIESDKTIDTVELSAEVVNKLAENNVDIRLAVVRGGTAIELDVKALSKKLMQADDSNLILSIKEVTDNMPTLAQMQTIGQRPAFDINLFSGDVRISAMGKEITIRVPYQLAEGETAEGIKVYYVDDEGNKEPCETFYDEAAGCVSWKTTHLSIYMIDYEAAVDEVLADEAPAANGSNIVLWIVLGVVVLAAAVAIAAVINSRKKQKA